MAMALQPDNAFTFTAPVATWRCDFVNEMLLTIRPISTEETLPPSRSHHHTWLQSLYTFFDSKGKILPQFNPPLVGTPYQHCVWKYLCSIPAGTTKTYSDVASALNSGARAVGQACRVNPFPLIVPCHRVVAKNGLGGYMGPNDSGLTIKQALLDLEQELK